MSSGIVFVLHGPADEKFATELATALAPLPALPVQLTEGARGVQVGGGAAAVVVWTQELCAPAMTRAVLAAVAHSSASVALCKGAVPPDALRVRMVACLPARADAIADSQTLRGVIAAALQQAEIAPRGVAPAIGRESGAVKGRPGMAARSAYGLIATLAVASVAGPMISERAAATNVPTPDAPPEAATTTAAAAPAPVEEAVIAADAAAATQVAAAQVVAPAHVERVAAHDAAPAAEQAPLLDQWILSTAEPAITDAAPVEASAVLTEAAAALDPKREAFAVHLEAQQAGAAKPGAPVLASAQKPVHLAGQGDAGSSPGE